MDAFYEGYRGGRDFRSAAFGFALPVKLERFLMPANHGLRLDEHECGFPICQNFRQKNPEPAEAVVNARFCDFMIEYVLL